jgi:hypothetical protein
VNNIDISELSADDVYDLWCAGLATDAELDAAFARG